MGCVCMCVPPLLRAWPGPSINQSRTQPHPHRTSASSCRGCGSGSPTTPSTASASPQAPPSSPDTSAVRILYVFVHMCICWLGYQPAERSTGQWCLPPSLPPSRPPPTVLFSLPPIITTHTKHTDASDESELDGGVLISGGYDMERSLQHMTPLADLVVTSHAKSHFLSRNEETLAAEDEGGLQRLKRSRSMHEFHQHMHVFDGKVGALSLASVFSVVSLRMDASPGDAPLLHPSLVVSPDHKPPPPNHLKRRPGRNTSRRTTPRWCWTRSRAPPCTSTPTTCVLSSVCLCLGPVRPCVHHLVVLFSSKVYRTSRPPPSPHHHINPPPQPTKHKHTQDMCFPGHFTFPYKHLVERCQFTAILHLERGGHGTFYEDWDAGTSRAFQIVREFVDCLQRDEVRGWLGVGVGVGG